MKATRLVSLVLLIVMVLSVANQSRIVSARSLPPDDLAAMNPVPTGWGDDGRWEVGVYWVKNYGGNGNLRRTRNDAMSVYNILGNGGWARRFAYGNKWAWEEDWKVSWRGGTENTYVDSVDLAYFSGHGGWAWDGYYWRWLVGPVFGVGGRNHDDQYLVPGDARRAYGDKDLEWVAFSACSTLNNTSRRYWAASMNGLHLLLGFKTTMYDVNQGHHFAWRVRWGWTVPQAWFAATDITQPQSGRVARVLANEYCHFWDRWGSVCADSYDWDYWWWDHRAGSEPALLIEPADLSYQMPVFNVATATPSDDMFDRLGNAFGFSPTVPAVLDDETQVYRLSEDNLDLTVDQQGMFYFADLDKLWVPLTDTVSFAANALTTNDIRHIADSFLSTNQLMPLDASFYEVVSDTISSATVEEVPASYITALGSTQTYSDVHETISSTVATVNQVIYSRHLVFTPTAGSPITFSVQGPGARLKVYVDAVGDVVGAMGGWRAIDDIGVLDTVSILTPTQMVSLYQQLGDVLNLAPTPLRSDVVTVTRTTVGYYEQPLGLDQSSLTPVYILDLDLADTDSGEIDASTAFIPAAASMLPPLAEITSVTEEIPMVTPGQIITLTAADASQPLSALGYGENLNFVLGQGPYTYTWKLSRTGAVIGTERSITYPAGIVDDLGVDKVNDVPMVIVLEVSDAAGQVSQTSQAFYFIGGAPQVQNVYLPITLRFR